MSAPPFAYYGGKTMLADRIVSLLPRHQHYVEPFAGSLAVLLAKPRVQCETVNDLDGDLMTFWQVLRDQPEELLRVCELTPHSRADYEVSGSRDNVSDLERARRVWARLAQGRKGSLSPRDGWRFQVSAASRGHSIPRDLTGYTRRLLPAAARLAGVTLESLPALELIKRYGTEPDTLIYADPPYLGNTRSSRGYRVEMPDIADHQALAEALRGCSAAVVLSGYDSPLYAELYDGWHTYRITTMTGQGGTNGERIEVLWSNRPLGQQASLFDEVAS